MRKLYILVRTCTYIVKVEVYAVPRKGEKCVTLNEEDYEIVEEIAKIKKMSRKAVVLDALEEKYPNYFQDERKVTA